MKGGFLNRRPAHSWRSGSVRDSPPTAGRGRYQAPRTRTDPGAIVAERPGRGRRLVTACPELGDSFPNPDRAQRFSSYRVESTHNIYLTTATGSGIPAALVLAAALSTGIFLACRRSSERRSGPPALPSSVGLALLAYAITNFFISAELAGSAIAWILLGSIVSMSELAPRQSNCTDTRGRG